MGAARERVGLMGASSYTARSVPPSPPSLPYHVYTPPSSPSLPYAVSHILPSAPPPPPPSSFLLPSCPPPPSYDESSEQQAKARVPPSGQWSGFYLQDGEKNFFTMHLSFSSSSNGVCGQCTDKEGKPEGGGLADILGTWKAFGDQQAVVKFEKHYRGGRSVDYEGYLTVGFNRIMGTYSNGSGSFEMDFEEQNALHSNEEQNAHSNEEQNTHSNEEQNALHSNDQHSAWVQSAPISQYS